MALLTSEVNRIRAELGYNVLSVGAEPYVAHLAFFDQVMQPYLTGGAATTSSTAVTAAAAPAPVPLTLASATGFSAGDSVVVDVDARQEVATVQSIAGATITLLLRLAHSGTYPVTVEGPETLVREYLGKLRRLSAPGGTIEALADTAGVKKVDEIEFFGGERGSAAMRDIDRLQRKYRNELAALIGIPNLRDGGGGQLALY